MATIPYNLDNLLTDIDAVLTDAGGANSITAALHNALTKRFANEIGRWTGLHFKIILSGTTPADGELSLNGVQFTSMVEDDTIIVGTKDLMGVKVTEMLSEVAMGATLVLRTHDGRRFGFIIKDYAVAADIVTFTINPLASNTDVAYTAVTTKDIVLEVIPTNRIMPRDFNATLDCKSGTFVYETHTQTGTIDFKLINEGGAFQGIVPVIASGSHTIIFTGNFNSDLVSRIPLGTELQAGELYLFQFIWDSHASEMMVYYDGIPNQDMHLTAGFGDEQVDLSWQPIEGITSQKVQRRLSGGVWYDIADISAGRSTYTDDKNLASGTVYDYRIEDNTGRRSNEVEVTTPSGSILFRDHFDVADLAGRDISTFSDMTFETANGHGKITAPAAATAVAYNNERIIYDFQTGTTVMAVAFDVAMPNADLVTPEGIGIRLGWRTDANNRNHINPRLQNNAKYRQVARIGGSAKGDWNMQDSNDSERDFQRLKGVWRTTSETIEWFIWDKGWVPLYDGAESITGFPVTAIFDITFENGDAGLSADYYALVANLVVADADFTTVVPPIDSTKEYLSGRDRKPFRAITAEWDLTVDRVLSYSHGLTPPEARSLELNNINIIDKNRAQVTDFLSGGNYQITDTEIVFTKFEGLDIVDRGTTDAVAAGDDDIIQSGKTFVTDGVLVGDMVIFSNGIVTYFELITATAETTLTIANAVVTASGWDYLVVKTKGLFNSDDYQELSIVIPRIRLEGTYIPEE